MWNAYKMNLQSYQYIESRNFKKLYFDLLRKLDNAVKSSYNMTNAIKVIMIQEEQTLEQYTRTKPKQTKLTKVIK